MRSTNSLISRLAADFPQLSFREAERFRWSADHQTIYMNSSLSNAEAFLLHEVSHAVLGHAGYTRDIELIQYERDAWHYAQTTLATTYQLLVNDDLIQDNLDTYRDWLHARSTCPSCQATGLQMGPKEYRCVACSHKWSVNEARVCGLKRYSQPTKKPL